MDFGCDLALDTAMGAARTFAAQDSIRLILVADLLASSHHVPTLLARR
jgi:hypothetical protein